MNPQKSTQPVTIHKWTSKGFLEQNDCLAIEEPLEIRLIYGADEARKTQSISITMRTPSDDFALAVGFLLTEGIITHLSDIEDVAYCFTACQKTGKENIINVSLFPSVVVDIKRLERHFYTSSSCGVCGKASIAAIQMQHAPQLMKQKPLFSSKIIQTLPQILRQQQAVFQKTGGLHAAALFNQKGELQLLCEDVGRHNAVDKLIGKSLLNNDLPLNKSLILVSGRASFELIQKSLAASIPILAAVGAPSSLAVQLAEQFGMTLIGFLRQQQFNIYTHQQRIYDINQ